MPTINFSTLTAAQGFSVFGTPISGAFAVSSAGDLNHDGLTDLAFATGLQNRGYVIYGRAPGNLGNIDLNSLTLAQGFVINGTTAPKINIGYSLASLGDINGDGHDDLGFGNPSSTGGPNVGRAFVIFGQSGNFTADLNLDTLAASQGVGFTTAVNNRHGTTLGVAMAAAGDVNNDGRPDMMLSGTRDFASNNYTGAVTIIYGTAAGNFTGGSLTPLPSTVGRLNGAAAYDDAGISVSGIGDVNGDGIDDMIVGAPGVDTPVPGFYANPDTGRAYVVYGTTGNFTAPIALNNLTPSQGFIVEYPRNIVVGLGFDVAGGGDMNGDGRADILIAAAGTTSTVGYEQSVVVLFGQASNIAGPIDVNTLTASQGMKIEAGPGQFSFEGATVHGRIVGITHAGDMNGDGLDDLAIVQNRRVSIVYGSTTLGGTLDLANLTDAQGFQITNGGAGFTGGGGIGGSVAAAGDQNGDGLADIIIPSLGGFTVIYGFATPIVWTGTPGDDSHCGGAADDSLFGDAGGDTLCGMGGDDTLVGFTGDDQLFGDLGNDRLDGGADHDTLDGGGGADLLIGGSGNDTYHLDAQDSVVETATGGNDTVVTAMTYTLTNASFLENLTLTGTGNFNGTGNNAANILIGNTGNNNLSGGNGHDTLFGDAGDDNLNGGAGQDSMSGGLGDDSYTLNDAGDVVVENFGEGTDRVNASVSHTLTAHVENLTMTAASFTGTGNDLANKLTGSNAGADTLIGGLGDDVVKGNNGNDRLIGGHGNDSLTGGNGNDVLAYNASSEGGDLIVGFVSGADRIEVSASGFGGGLMALQALTANQFVQNSTGLATQANGQFVFQVQGNQRKLFWDADGAGGNSADLVATLSNGTMLAAGDIWLV
jgi:Ca2+-binding RTX toxin-like protein